MYISISWLHSAHGSQKEGTGFPPTGVTGYYETAWVCWKPNIDPLKKQ